MKWKKLESKERLDLKWAKIVEDKCELPDGRVMPKYFTIQLDDWVNVIPVTKNLEVVLVEQYRHSAQKVCVEIPGGAGHGVDSLEDAKRELIEETGYTSKEWIGPKAHFPNPALQNNKMNTFLALNCEKTHDQNLDPYEDINVIKVPLKDFIKYSQNNIDHSIVLAGIFQFYDEIQNLLQTVKK